MMASVQILKCDPDDKHKFVLDVDQLREIFIENQDVRDNAVIVVSVAGRYRTGKSFLLSLMHKYLLDNYSTSRGRTDEKSNDLKDVDFWASLKDVDGPCFDWKGGCEAHTVGLWISRQPFFVRLPSGDQASIFLLDTAGTFQTQASVRECGTVFGLATLLSSLLIYNIMNNVGEDDLHNLHLFAECGKLAAENTNLQPFQTLLFLVRDWIDGRRFPFGSTGGLDFLKKVLDDDAGTAPEEVRNVRKFLKSSFRELDCYLMPRPGDEVADAGSLTDCDFDSVKPAFKDTILTLIYKTLQPQHLIIKQSVPGVNITGKQIFQLFQDYLAAYNEALPDEVLSSVVQITSVMQHEAAKTKALAEFRDAAKKVEMRLNSFHSLEELKQTLQPLEESSTTSFSSCPKMGDESITRKYLDELMKEIKLIEDSLLSEMNIIVRVRNSKERYKELMQPVVEKLVTFDDEEVLVKEHTIVNDDLIKTFDDEEVSVSKCLEISMRYRSELADWISSQLQELNRILKTHQAAVGYSLDTFRVGIEQIKLDVDSFEDQDEFDKRLRKASENAFDFYREFDKSGEEHTTDQFQNLLNERMEPESLEVRHMMKHVLQLKMAKESHGKEFTKLKLELTQLNKDSLIRKCIELRKQVEDFFHGSISEINDDEMMHARYKEHMDSFLQDQHTEIVEVLETHEEAVREALRFLNKEIGYIQEAMGDYTEIQFHTRKEFLHTDISKLFTNFKKREDKVATVRFLDLLDLSIEEHVEKLILERKHIFKIKEAKTFYKENLEKVKAELVTFEKESDLVTRHDGISEKCLHLYDSTMAEDIDLFKQYHGQLEDWLQHQLNDLLHTRDTHRKAQNLALFHFIESIKEIEDSLDKFLPEFSEISFNLEKVQAGALAKYDSAEKFGDRSISVQYKNDLKGTIGSSVQMVLAKYQHVKAYTTAMEHYKKRLEMLNARIDQFRTLADLEQAYKPHEEDTLGRFLSACPEGDYTEYSDHFSSLVINDMTLRWNEISYDMQCILAKRDAQIFCEKAIESIKQQVKNISSQQNLENLLKPVKEKTDLLYKGIEKAAKTAPNLAVYTKHDNELENFIGNNFKQLGQFYKDNVLLRESMEGAQDKYKELVDPIMRKRWLDWSEHVEDFAWAEKLALTEFDELSAKAEIARDMEVHHDLKMVYIEELRKSLEDQAVEMLNQRYRANLYNGFISVCVVFLVGGAMFSMETIISLILIGVCMIAGYIFVQSKQEKENDEPVKKEAI